MKKYSVKIRDGRWIKYCDHCWYETCEWDNREYTYEEAKAIAEQLKSHYVYVCWICSDDGEEKVSAFKNKAVEPKPTVVDNFGDFDFDMDDMDDIIKRAEKIN